MKLEIIIFNRPFLYSNRLRTPSSWITCAGQEHFAYFLPVWPNEAILAAVSRTLVGRLCRVGAFRPIFRFWPNEAIPDGVLWTDGPAQRSVSSYSPFWPNEAILDAVSRTLLGRLNRVGAGSAVGWKVLPD
jgi:hypothetical protein